MKMELESGNYECTWSGMTPINQYAAIMAFTKGMTEEAADLMCRFLDTDNPVMVFNSDWTKCWIHEDDAPAIELLIKEYFKNR